MAHGKETPRQKMIGMMYLVLMAMLALNVSNEVLNAFGVLDDGLKRTIATLEQTNDKVLSDFTAQYELNKTKVGPWLEKAQKVKEDADKIFNFIQDNQIKILEISRDQDAIDAEKNIDTKLIKSKDNTEAPAIVMIGDNNEKAGKELRIMLDDYRNYLITEVVQSESSATIRESIESALSTTPTAKEGGKEKAAGHTEALSWESEHFEHLPLSGVITIMSGLQINVRNAESEALKYLYGQISAGEVSFNKVSATIIPNSNYIIKGNDYRAEVFLAASDTTADPDIYVTTDSRPYDSVEIGPKTYEYKRREGVEYTKLDVVKSSGKGIFKVPATSLGMKRWGGVIEVTSPSGTMVKPFRQSYLVAEGSFSVAPIKMNVFYLGVDNPVDVSVAGVQPDKVDISVTNARHVKEGGSYIIRPIRPGNAFVIVYAEIDGEKREMGRKEFRVKTVPTPVAMVNNQKGGAINQGVLLAQIGVIAEMEAFEFDLKFTITEFTVSAVVQGFVREYSSKSDHFTQDQKNLIKSLTRGNSVYIQDIKAVGPDGATRPLSTINFKLN
jgi:hypothetical protein